MSFPVCSCGNPEHCIQQAKRDERVFQEAMAAVVVVFRKELLQGDNWQGSEKVFNKAYNTGLSDGIRLVESLKPDGGASLAERDRAVKEATIRECRQRTGIWRRHLLDHWANNHRAVMTARLEDGPEYPDPDDIKVS